MIDPQTWPPLCGAVAGCGALIAVAGGAKLARPAHGTAVQKALRLSRRRWRFVQAAAGTAELAVGLLVCVGVPPVLADALMACQGAIFTAVLSRLIHLRVSGACGCVARRTPNRHGVTPWMMARAVFIAAAGIAGAAIGVRTPSALPGDDDALAWAVAFGVLTLLVAVDFDLHTRCRRRLLFPTRKALAEVTGHGTYQAMAASLGAGADRVLFRRAGCADEFWFPAREDEQDPRYLTIKAARTPSGALALRAAIAETAPHADLKVLPIRRNRSKSQPSARRARLQG